MGASRRLELVTGFFYFDQLTLRVLMSIITITLVTTTWPSVIDSCQEPRPMLTLYFVASCDWRAVFYRWGDRRQIGNRLRALYQSQSHNKGPSRFVGVRSLTMPKMRPGHRHRGYCHGCWLVDSGVVGRGDEVLGTIAKEWKTVEKCVRFPHSPETGAQFEYA
jgi:hypothetical protein